MVCTLGTTPPHVAASPPPKGGNGVIRTTTRRRHAHVVQTPTAASMEGVGGAGGPGRGARGRRVLAGQRADAPSNISHEGPTGMEGAGGQAAAPAGDRAWPGNTQTPRPIGGRREACGAWPGFEPTRRAKLAARTASGRAGRAAAGDLSGQQSTKAGRPPPTGTPSSPAQKAHPTPGTPAATKHHSNRHGLKDKKSWWRVSPSCFGGGLCGGGRARRWRRPIWG